MSGCAAERRHRAHCRRTPAGSAGPQERLPGEVQCSAYAHPWTRFCRHGRRLVAGRGPARGACSRCTRSSGNYGEQESGRRRRRAAAVGPSMPQPGPRKRWPCVQSMFVGHPARPGRAQDRREGVETVQKQCGSRANSQGQPSAGWTGGEGGQFKSPAGGKGLTTNERVEPTRP